LSQLERVVDEYRPDLTIWHKDDGDDLSSGFVEKIASQTRLVYHDLDPWVRWIKPIRPNQVVLAKVAHRIYLCGTGSIANLFAFAHERIRYSPHGYYDLDIPPPCPAKRNSMVFIGSVHRRGARILGPLGPEQHPGRTRAVKILKERLGPNFEVYGRGYPARWKIEPCDFSRQFSLIAENLASFAIDAAPHAPHYFSNRTPFSLACGSLHFKIRRTGDEDQFRNCPGLIPVRSANEAADQFEIYRSMSGRQLREIDGETRKFARENFRQPDLYHKMIKDAMSD
jgi:hypothetical protein